MALVQAKWIHGTICAIGRTNWNNDTEVSVDSGEGDGSTGSTLSEPMRTRPGEGAETLDCIIPKLGTLFHLIPQAQIETFKA